MICPNDACQKHIPSEVNFCSYCGTKVRPVLQHRPVQLPPPLYIRLLPFVPVVLLGVAALVVAFWP